jgi:hypothetical protein
MQVSLVCAWVSHLQHPAVPDRSPRKLMGVERSVEVAKHTSQAWQAARQLQQLQQ